VTVSALAPALCRDCLESFDATSPPSRCPTCGSGRVVWHAELRDLAIAHVDCDSFYASIEKRDRPELRDQPILIGGTDPRSVVATACYLARQYGCRSAMPMYKARELCPQAVIVRPDHGKYRRVSGDIHRILHSVTSLIEPLALDEAYLDLSHREDIPEALADIAQRVEQEVGISLSVGLSYNKFLAKTASDLQKPRGFSVIGRAEAVAFLAPRPVRAIHGVGPAMERRLQGDGFTTIGDLQQVSEMELKTRYGAHGGWLWRIARGQDTRSVTPERESKSISAETTFQQDLSRPADLLAALAPLAERVERSLRRHQMAAAGVVLKLKSRDFKQRSRHLRLPTPSQQAGVLLTAVRPLLEREVDGTLFRLIGIGAEPLVDGALADPPDLFSCREHDGQ